MTTQPFDKKTIPLFLAFLEIKRLRLILQPPMKRVLIEDLIEQIHDLGLGAKQQLKPNLHGHRLDRINRFLEETCSNDIAYDRFLDMIEAITIIEKENDN